jgi:hypothetical protein
MIIMSTNMSEETYEKVRSLTSAREVWLELHRLFDGLMRIKPMISACSSLATRWIRLMTLSLMLENWRISGKTWKLDKDEDKNLLLKCRIVETLPSEYFSFASSWRLLNKAERTVENLTDQLCSYERAPTGRAEPVHQEALFAKSHDKPAQKSKNPAKDSK